MSHFSVIVIGENIKEQLAPYEESPPGGSPFLVFDDRTDEVKTEFETRGKLDKSYVRKYPTLQKWAEGYYACDVREINGQDRFGAMRNPNAKWDWWQIGGRWSGWLGTVNGPADSAVKAQLDWTAKRAEAEATARRRFAWWQQALDATKGAPLPISWDEMRDKKMAGQDIEKIRVAYHAQPQIAAWKKIVTARDPWEAFDTDPVNDFGYNVETFVAQCRRRASVPFAFLLDGVWHERGEMGWFGCVSDEKPLAGWCETWEKALDALPDSAVLTVVDCHI